ncbi:ribonuclease J [Microbaculum marinum]|uniref:Ribonuclease J n=1 Tax=Microbaculum marinum TaxID=1764581 RepID=A0AAW9RYZ2_9HYPH
MARSEELVFLPLGGVGEIGMNLGLYGYGRPGRWSWLMVDCGVSFAAEEHLPGIDLIFPDIGFIEEERGALEGIVITHAHEDHFGALPDLWPRLRAPVYATPFTAGLLSAKIDEEPGASPVPVEVVPLGGRFKAGPFDVELISVTHSIPEPNAVVIRTPAGTVLHTADWKIDADPVIGQPFDPAPFIALGREGCRAIVCDSTNVLRPGRSPGEGDVRKGLAEAIAEAPHRVAVTAFASNVARIRSVAEAAAAAGRSVVVVGRAMRRVIAVSREQGLLEGLPAFLGEDMYRTLPRDKVVLLCTGSQGEPRAALTRIAAGNHPTVSLASGDRVIYSARSIPGNEREIGTVVNALTRAGIEIVTDDTHLVHVSGHPRREELQDMYGWVRPEVAVPVHGEARHLVAHAKLAREMKVPEVVTAYNGDMVRLAPGPAEIVDEVPAGRLYKDGRITEREDSDTVRDRRRLSFSGFVGVGLAIDERGEAVGDPDIELIGVPEFDAMGVPFVELVYDAVEQTLRGLPRARRRDPDALAESMRRAVRNAVNAGWGKKPVCHVFVMTV